MSQLRVFSFGGGEKAVAFAKRVQIGTPDECWNWKLKTNQKGYGRFSWDKTVSMAHRVAYELVNDPIPEGLAVCHSCDNPKCVNPNHLWLGTLADNNQDMFAKGRGHFPPVGINSGTFGNGRSSKGKQHPRAKLSEEQVEEIRKLRQEGLVYREIAEWAGISICHAHKIATGQSWRKE